MKAKKKAARRVPQIPRKYFDAVDRGIKWLDLTIGRKEWLSRMDMKNFDINDPNTCVAGNVFEQGLGSDGYDNFMEAMKYLDLWENKDGERLGFYSDDDKGMQYLQDIWVRVITKMKKQKA